MDITDLRAEQSGVEVEAEITEISEAREFSRFGRPIRVATATIRDKSGEAKLSLWNQDIEKVKVGDRIKLSNGFVREFQNELQVTAGKFGKIEVLEVVEGAEKSTEEPKKRGRPKKEKEESIEEEAEEEMSEEVTGEE
ncbi:MAG: SOSS complex subunit B family protein [Nanoarchaeota archaeon]